MSDQPGSPSRRQFLSRVGTGAVAAGAATGSAAGSEEGSVRGAASDPTLAELRDRWFLEFDGNDVTWPPSDRQFDLPRYSTASVEMFYDGASFMQAWYDAATELTQQYPQEGEIYHQTLRLREVPLLGETRPDTISLDVIDAANDAGVDLYFMLSGDIQHGDGNARVADQLGIETVVTDSRVASAGSLHQKVSLFRSPDWSFATVGSSDLYPSRWGQRPWVADDPDRPGFGPGHDLTVRLEGPVVRDIQQIHTRRWNDPSRDQADGLGETTTPPELDTTPIDPPETGDQEVQILQTFGRTRNGGGYSWSDEGEFTGWAGYVNAIQQAQEYIYIEDQFFMPEGRPPWNETAGERKQASLFFHLGEALKRGVDVIATTTTAFRSGPDEVLDLQRYDGVNYLDDIAETASGEFEVTNLKNAAGQSVTVHSKLMLIDDEVTFVGSMNTGRRSLSNDGEIQLAIIDANNQFTKDVRTELWRVYMGEDPASETIPPGIGDIATGPSTFVQAIRDGTGLLTRFPRQGSVQFDALDRDTLNYAGDPYGGPPVGGGFAPVVGTDEPRDILGDGLFRDVRGDGELNIFDVQTLFDHLDSDVLSNNPEAFDFSRSGDGTVDVADVQALFEDVERNVTEQEWDII